MQIAFMYVKKCLKYVKKCLKQEDAWVWVGEHPKYFVTPIYFGNHINY